MYYLAMSDGTIISIVTMITAMLTTAFGGYMSYKMAQLKSQQDAAEAKTEEVKSTLLAANAVSDRKLSDAVVQVKQVKEALVDTNAANAEKFAEIAQTTSQTHELVDGAMGAQLSINRIATQRVAEITEDPTDIALAKLAKQAHESHEATQAKETI